MNKENRLIKGLIIALVIAAGAAQAGRILADSYEAPSDPIDGDAGNLWDQMHWDKGQWQ